MSDPCVALKNALQTVFLLEPKRNDRYIFPAIQQLQQALKEYRPNKRNTFIDLIKAVREALPYIEKWHIDFTTIKKPVDALAKTHQSRIDWDKYLLHTNTSPKFQFSALNHTRHNVELIPWLNAKSGATLTERDNPSSRVKMLLEYKEHFGFSQKLSAHLKKDPDFLFRLIMHSEKNFTKIASTRLILYLTDQQLAKAIIKHSPNLMSEHRNPMQQIESLIHKLNEILSNGRSVSTLLRNTEAKFILGSSVHFQIYLSHTEEKTTFKTKLYPPSMQEEEDGRLKPDFY